MTDSVVYMECEAFCRTLESSQFRRRVQFGFVENDDGTVDFVKEHDGLPVYQMKLEKLIVKYFEERYKFSLDAFNTLSTSDKSSCLYKINKMIERLEEHKKVIMTSVGSATLKHANVSELQTLQGLMADAFTS